MVVRRPALDERGEEARLALVVAALLDLALQLGVDGGDGAVDDLLVEVADRDRNLEAPEEERRELARHQPCADDSDLSDRARLGVRLADVLLGAALDEVEGVERGLGLAAGQELGDRVFLGRIALLQAPFARAFDQVERHVGGRRGAVQRVVQLAPGFREQVSVGRVRGTVPRAWRFGPFVEQERDRVVEELRRIEHRIDEPELCASAPVEHPVLT